jgi:alpha-amylase/alpha-mannosidase (GH57 family)
MDQPRYVIIHGHFYQPPRESPWTGLVMPEHGAAPFANWNERILSESYIANARAHVNADRIVHIRNNYETINFDLGPTLASWLEHHGKLAYRAFQRGDELRAELYDGHGNGIAQTYSHSIMPLLNERDRAVQLEWGIRDFSFRFKRRPEGVWLPECAVDDATLVSIAHAGLKFTILAPEQGRFEANEGSVHEAGPFMWQQGSDQVAVFRYNRELSAQVSFGDALNDGLALADKIGEYAKGLAPGAVLMIATDGETFGHHKRIGAAELARAIAALQERDGIILTNCGQYLATHVPTGTFRIDGASSWSCPHGIERWRTDCGCRMEAGTTQAWRRPLREAMEFVKHHAAATYDRFAAAIIADPIAALMESISIIVNADNAVSDDFFRRFKVADEEKQIRLMRLFEMERAGHAALTSCAWFFDDFGGPEGRVALKWAARSVELAAEVAPSIENELLERLRAINSNRREVGDAATLYLSLKTREARGRV